MNIFDLPPIPKPVELTGSSLTIKNVLDVARFFYPVKLSPAAKKKMQHSRAWVERAIAKGKTVYGVTTGFGSFQDVHLQPEQVKELQRNLVLSHSAGVGEPFSTEAIRAMMLLRANALAAGHSGVRADVAEKLLELLNKSVHPFVPSKGSVGSSGDLAPLAHIAAVLIGEGEATIGEETEYLHGGEALKQAGITPLTLEAKEGLALLNGTQAMLALAVFAVADAENLLQFCGLTSALTLEALQAKSVPFQKNVHTLRPYPGQQTSADFMRGLLKGSTLIDRVDTGTKNTIQDSYSLRCIPQVHGASMDAVGYARIMVQIELNSVTDNPLIFPEQDEAVSAGNFHGQPIALVMDFLKLAVSELGSISERRTAKLLDKNHNNGLPPFLTDKGGLHSGLMLAQYTAASLASENKTLIHPASGDSIPTSANQEDHNSMGTIAARNAIQVIDNVEYIIAIELLCAAQAIDFRLRQHPDAQLGEGTKYLFALIREELNISFMETDRNISVDIEDLKNLIHFGSGQQPEDFLSNP